MSIRELLACCVIVSLSGCLYHARERTDGTVSNLVSHPYDVMPAGALAAAPAPARRSLRAPVPEWNKSRGGGACANTFRRQDAGRRSLTVGDCQGGRADLEIPPGRI